MAGEKVFIEKSTLTDIADGIRSKHGNTATYLPRDMKQAILDIAAGGEDLSAELTEQENLLDELKAALEGKAVGQPMEMVATFADGTTKTYVIYGGIAE